MEATYLCLLETVGNGFGLVQGSLKMVLSSFPLMCRRRGHTGDRTREAEDLPERHRASIEQLTRERIKFPSLRTLAEHNKALDHEGEHPPRTKSVRSAAAGQPRSLFTEHRQCASVIAHVSHLAKEGSDTNSPDRDFPFKPG